MNIKSDLPNRSMFTSPFFSWYASCNWWRFQYLEVPFPPCGWPLWSSFACLDSGPCTLFPFLSLSGVLSFYKVWQGFINRTLCKFNSLFYKKIYWHFFCIKKKSFFHHHLSWQHRVNRENPKSFFSAFSMGIVEESNSLHPTSVPSNYHHCKAQAQMNPSGSFHML